MRGSASEARRLLERHALPGLGRLRLRDVTDGDVRRVHRALSATPSEANRMLAALSACWGWAARVGQAPQGANPTRYVERCRERGQRRAFTPDELSRLGSALQAAEQAGSVHSSVLLALRLLALTGMRRAEVVGQVLRDRRGEQEGLRWSDVDLDAGIISLRETKAGGPQLRVIGQAAIELLRGAKPATAEPSDCVCPGEQSTSPYFSIDKARRRLFAAAGITGADAHSLRHSFASIGAHVLGGRYVGMVSPLLGHGHQAKSITERYITGDPQALRPAADAICGEIARLLGMSEPGQVLLNIRSD